MVNDYLSDAKIIQDGWVNKDWIQSNLNDFISFLSYFSFILVF
jgi:hypothetical protein